MVVHSFMQRFYVYLPFLQTTRCNGLWAYLFAHDCQSTMVAPYRCKNYARFPKPHAKGGHDISDDTWHLLEPVLPGRKGCWGRVAQDNRRFINAIFWILRTGVPWRDLPPDYGDWENTHRRFSRWRDKGVWKRILEHLIQDPDYEWLMIDSSHIKVHPHASGANGFFLIYRISISF